jgi:hypothetical protein
MDGMSLVLMLLTAVGSMGGMVMLCSAIATRNRREARRELFGLRPGEDSWP